MRTKKKKSKKLRLFQRILLLAALCLGATACTIGVRGSLPVVWVDEVHPGPIRHVYYYYPEVGIYFDPGPSLYYWHENNRWRSAGRLPGHIGVGIGRRFRFESDADRPYIVHQRVVERFDSRGGQRPRPHDARRR